MNPPPCKKTRRRNGETAHGSGEETLPGNIVSEEETSYKSADILGAGFSGSGGLHTGMTSPGGRRKGRKQKSLAVSAGTVSNFLRKDYVGANFKKGDRFTADQMKPKGLVRLGTSNEEAEEFLCSMLGYESEIDMGIIRDVLCHCGYDVEKALENLLELSASSYNKESDSAKSSQIDTQDGCFLLEESCNDLNNSFIKKCQVSENDLAFHLSKEELQEVLQSARYDCSEISSPDSRMTNTDLQQKILESLFNIPKSSKHNPSSMDWRKVATKLESFGQPRKLQTNEVPKSLQNVGHAKGDEYQLLRGSANHHWNTMKSYFQQAAVAYSRGQRDHAVYLSEQGRLYNKKACEADEKASQEIFEVRNKNIQNTVTIDLHGQHVKHAMKLLKLHLFLCTHLPSVHFLNVITGCGTHGVGKGKLKHSVIKLLDKESVEWRDENIGAIIIKLDGRKEFSFLDSESDSE